MNNRVKNIVMTIAVSYGSVSPVGPLEDSEIEFLKQFGITETDDGRFEKTEDTKNFFKLEEFQCPHCGKGTLNSETIKMLNVARAWAGVPFILNSAYRCKKHNADVGGSETSSHVVRRAVDIQATDSRTRQRVLEGLIVAGFNRIGIAESFIHADNDPNKDPEVVWLY